MPVLGAMPEDVARQESGGRSLKLYILHDNSEWMKAWRPALDSHFGPNGYEEWLLDGTGQSHRQNFFDLNFDFGRPPPQGVFFCKGSGSSFSRGLPHARDVFQVVLQWLEYHGRLVVNGERAFAVETSKVSQLVAMSNFGMKFAKTTAIFGTGSLVEGAKAFLSTLADGQGFWIRFNRAGCGRGLCLCYSVEDVKAFVRTGKRSPDEIYILQEWINTSAVVRMEFSFGRLLYGLEIRNVHGAEHMAPCGCIPQLNSEKDHSSVEDMCTALISQSSQSFTELSVSSKAAVGFSAVTGMVGMAGGALMACVALRNGFVHGYRLLVSVDKLSAMLPAPPAKPSWEPPVIPTLTGFGLLSIGVLAFFGRHSGISLPASKKKAVVQQNPVRLVQPAALQKEYPVLATLPDKVKPLMQDLGAGTMALDVAMVDSQVMVLDINIHTNYGAQREKDHGIVFEQTGVGSACLGLSSLLRGIEQSAELDLGDMPSDNLVFGIGLPRTGTHSLAESLKALGYRGRHNSSLGKRHMQYTPKTRQFSGYFHVDTSHFRKYEELFTTHPNARFILSTRLDEDWKASMGRHGGPAEDMPTPNEYLSEVLRFFVNHHATHRLMVCNLFSEPDELLWSKLIGFLPLARKFEVREQQFPRINEEVDGSISKAIKVHKSPSQQLLGDFKAPDEAAGAPPSPYTLQSLQSPAPNSKSPTPSIGSADSEISQANKVLGRYLDYKKTYAAKWVVRPDNADVAQVSVLTNKRLTPKSYDRHIFHLEMSVQGTALEGYDAGDCIGIYPENPHNRVNEFLANMKFDGTELLELDTFFTGTEDGVYVMSVSQVCTEYLDLFGQPTREFYLALSKFAKVATEKETLAELSLERKKPDFDKRDALANTYASTICEFPSLTLTPMNLLDLVPLTKPRLYSIASSRHAHPGEVHLLAVTHTWENSMGEECVGLATGYMEKMRSKDASLPLSSGSIIVASLVRSPVLKLPKDPSTPVIMAGMGTGMAPFRGFVEERAMLKKEGRAIGNMRLYFGARHKHGEFLYQSELEGYEAQGWLKLRCAWSRDQARKIYVQMLIEEDGDAIWEALRPEAGGAFYICGPIAPLPDIKKAITNIFEKHGKDAAYLEEMEATGRFATEVY